MPLYSLSFKSKKYTNWKLNLLYTIFCIILLIILIILLTIIIAAKNLPSIQSLINYQPKMPLKIYTEDNILIGEFGEERRDIIKIEDIPIYLKNAILSIEDSRFYEHKGVDLNGIIRAITVAITNRHATQGASTITMQVARNFFLSNKKTYIRKIYEILLAYKIESKLSKDQIFNIYLNQIYLGQHSYGFASASRIYFGKNLKNILLSEAAMLAGLPKAPSIYNPVINLKRAKIRQMYILQRMLNLRYINKFQYEEAIKQQIKIKNNNKKYKIHCEYAAEIVRQIMFKKYKKTTYTRGLKVITTINSCDQNAAYYSLRNGLISYERKYKYRGPEAFIKFPNNIVERNKLINKTFLKYPNNEDIITAIVISSNTKQIKAILIDRKNIIIQKSELNFVKNFLDKNSKKQIKPGSIIRVKYNLNKKWSIVQLPKVEGSIVSISPLDGSIKSLVGGFDFNKNNFNHVTQAWRQPGSSFKPFIYAAALDKGVGPATIINDGPLYFNSNENNGKTWNPKNYGGKFDGPITMRNAFQRSRNLVSIHILNYIGVKYAQKYITKFGFSKNHHPAYLPMALGAGLVTPLHMVRGISVFANGGYRINPYLIKEVIDSNGVTIAYTKPLIASKNAPKVINSSNAYIMNSLLQSVAQYGTASKSNILGRNDISGKTGTTNNSRDAWFVGYQNNIAAVTWVGYDNPRTLGSKETGSKLALPIWIDYMKIALKNTPNHINVIPNNVLIYNNELYLNKFRPNYGFIPSINLDLKEKLE